MSKKVREAIASVTPLSALLIGVAMIEHYPEYVIGFASGVIAILLSMHLLNIL